MLYKIKKTHEIKSIISNQAGLCLSRSPEPPIGMDAAGPGMLGTWAETNIHIHIKDLSQYI